MPVLTSQPNCDGCGTLEEFIVCDMPECSGEACDGNHYCKRCMTLAESAKS